MLVLAVGLLSAQALIGHLGERFSIKYSHYTPTYLNESKGVLYTQIVFSAFLATNVITLLGLAVCYSIIRRFGGSLRRRLKWSSLILASLICLALILSGPLSHRTSDSAPGDRAPSSAHKEECSFIGPIPSCLGMWNTMAGELFNSTVFTTLGSDGLSGSLHPGWNALDICTLVSNVTFVFAAAFVVYAVSGTYRSFREALPRRPDSPEDEERYSTVSRSFVYKLRTLLFIASTIMVAGLVNMIAWGIWPLAYLDETAKIYQNYRGIVAGSIIYHGAVYSLILIVIFFRPFMAISEILERPSKSSRGRSVRSAIAGSVSWIRDAAMHLAPLGTAIATALWAT